MERLQREGFEELAQRVKREMGMWGSRGSGTLAEGGGVGSNGGEVVLSREGTSGVA